MIPCKTYVGTLIHFFPISHIILQNSDLERVNQMLDLTQDESKSVETILNLCCLALTKHHAVFLGFSEISLQSLLTMKISLSVHRREKRHKSNHSITSTQWLHCFQGWDSLREMAVHHLQSSIHFLRWEKTDCLALSPVSTACQLCNLGQITYPLCISDFSSIKIVLISCNCKIKRADE